MNTVLRSFKFTNQTTNYLINNEVGESSPNISHSILSLKHNH